MWMVGCRNDQRVGLVGKVDGFLDGVGKGQGFVKSLDSFGVVVGVVYSSA